MNNDHIKHLEEYYKVYRRSIEKPENFWEEIAETQFIWRKKWDKVLEWDFSIPTVKWYINGKLNITENCIDRHLPTKGEEIAIQFEPNNPKGTSEQITYNQLYIRVNKLANVLKEQGIKKGDRVCIYLPMIPELAISLLACARIGAIHSVVFAGFSAAALSTRINDAKCGLVITSDGSFRGEKTINLKEIVDQALLKSPIVQNVLVVKHTNSHIQIKQGRDQWLTPLTNTASGECQAEEMDAEDPLFILYTSGSTGTPKGMVHTTGGYMVYTGYTFRNVFNYRNGDVYWCTADIGWITGHSYLLYGPLLNGATTVMFEGIPSYPNCGRCFEIIEKYGVTQFYTAPTVIRALAKADENEIKGYNVSSLKVIGSVGEPINKEAWNWYNDHVGKNKTPIVDTWWQTETGGIMLSPIPYVTPTIPTYATLPLPGIQPTIMDAEGKEIIGNQVEGNLCIKYPWPGIARTIWGNHQRYKQTYFDTYKGMYFSGDGAARNEVGYYRITGRVDDVIIVSGHNLGTATIEDVINEHPDISECAIVGIPHPIKGNALYGYITLKDANKKHDTDLLHKEINQNIVSHIGGLAKLNHIQLTEGLPKTRSGKIVRRILRKIATNDLAGIGDTSTLINPEVIDEIKRNKTEY